MTNIDKHISELFFNHDCVILPGFGGFLTNYSGARIHPIKHSFQPPARTIVFNANLQTNDGLLADYISRNRDISYTDAASLVNAYAESCLKDLEAGKTVYFKNIGNCKMGRENNIIFEPDASANFLDDAFGLPSFVSPAIKRETIRKRLEEQISPRPVAPDPEKKRKLRPAIGWAAALLIPVTAAALLYFFNPSFFDGQNTSYTSMMPFLKLHSGEPAKSPGTFDKNADYVNFRVLPEPIVEEEIVAETIPEAVAEAVPETIPEATPEVIPEVTPVNALKKYQIVVGAFSKERNADKYVQELQNKSYDAAIIGKSSNGLFRVSISGFDGRSDALSMLDKVRREENSSAWLLVIR